MIQLIFNPSSFPRTITRSEWKDIWRWKRVTQKKLSEEFRKEMDNFRIYGSTWAPYMQRDFINQIVNPPIMMHPRQRI